MTNSTPDRPPLWRVMQEAAANARNAHYRFAASDRVLAAEIRAIADEMVMQFDPWLQEHEAVAAWLTAEADRAERNDG